VYTWLWWESLKEGNYLEDLGLDGRITLKWIFMNGMGGVDWINLAEDRERWRVLVTAEMNLWVP